MNQLEAFALAVEQTFEVGVGVCVDIMLLEDGEAGVLHYGVFERADLEFVGAVDEGTVGVYPGQEGGDVGQFGEGDDGFVELYLAAGYELALEDPVIDLLMQDFLPACGSDCLAMLVEHCIEIAGQFIGKSLNSVP